MTRVAPLEAAAAVKPALRRFSMRSLKLGFLTASRRKNISLIIAVGLDAEAQRDGDQGREEIGPRR
jgi:hypothetical protein